MYCKGTWPYAHNPAWERQSTLDRLTAIRGLGASLGWREHRHTMVLMAGMSNTMTLFGNISDMTLLYSTSLTIRQLMSLSFRKFYVRLDICYSTYKSSACSPGRGGAARLGGCARAVPRARWPHPWLWCHHAYMYGYKWHSNCNAYGNIDTWQ